MNILFLTIAYPDKNSSNLYSDLMQEFARHGHNVFVLCSQERRLGKSTSYLKENGVMVLRKRTLNLTKTNILEKGLSMLLIEYQFIRAIKNHFSEVTFDLVIYSTPPITFGKAIRFIKNRDCCFSYLLLKDIFPQNAVDLGMIKKDSLIWKYFRQKEKRLYEISDKIGCMSKANVKYVLQHNPNILKDQVEECPNSINPKPVCDIKVTELNLRHKYHLPQEALICLYGGNLGKPQGLDFLIDIFENTKDRSDIFFVIVGSGTEYKRLETYLKKNSQSNVCLMSHMSKQEYDQLVGVCDVGLIFLHPKFTIPNFPSRLISYMEASLPVLAATDVHTDIKDVLEEGNFGLWGRNGDIEAFINHLNTMASGKKKRIEMGSNGRQYLEKHYTVARAYNIITSHIKS